MKRKKSLLFLTMTILVMGALMACSNSEPEAKATAETETQDGKVIGIIGAMSEEVEILHDKMEIESTETVAGMEFYQGVLDGENIVLVQSGVGKVNAAACTQALVDHFGVDYVINSGVAGGLGSEVAIGDIVISTDTVQHDFDVTAFGNKPGEISRMDTSFFEADEKLIDLAQSAAEGLSDDINVFQGRIATGDQFIASKEQQDKIMANFEPLAVEMEGAAIAQTAFLNDVPFVIIRAISDDGGGEAEDLYDNFLQKAAENASEMIEEMIGNIDDTL